jgi:transposase
VEDQISTAGGAYDATASLNSSTAWLMQLAAFKALVENGPDLARDGVVRWRCSDLQARLQTDFDVRYHERSVGKLLAKLAFRKLTARPFHPEQDVAAQEAHKKTSPP